MKKRRFTPLLLALVIILAAAALKNPDSSSADAQSSSLVSAEYSESVQQSSSSSSDVTVSRPSSSGSSKFSLSDVPEYSGSPYVEVHNNKPYFSKKQKKHKKSYESYGRLDSLGRCTKAVACIGTDLMPTEPRGEIGDVRPSGWPAHNPKYAGIDGNYLFNRCHLIGYQLTGENANERNLITGTRYLNVDGMLPFENEVADYLTANPSNHVLYRVTPIFKKNNLLASGVLMEAYSVEDKGQGVCFCVYCYNVQPGVTISYSDSSSTGPEFTGSGSYSSSDSSSDSSGNSSSSNSGNSSSSSDSRSDTGSDSEKQTYILNTNTKKFHYPWCSSVSHISSKNKKKYTGKRKYLIREGYSPCGICNP